MVIGRHVLFQERVIGGSTPVIPPDAIALWSGTLVTIPANWALCDGADSTPNLIARFLRGAPAATDPGTINGSDSHSHASMTSTGGHTHTAQTLNHQHEVNVAGNHTHLAGGGLSPISAGVVMENYSGNHQHTVNSASHSHTMNTTANHTHPRSTDDGRPPYYEIAYIQAGAGALVAANLIIIWTGLLADIPAGWSLCDSGAGRPDLRATFIRGVNTNVTNPGTTGGDITHGHTETAQPAHTHTMNNASAHSHTFNLHTWTHNHDNFVSGGVGGSAKQQSDTGAGNHTHTTSNTIDTHNHNAMGNDGGHAHTVDPASSLPVYYDVAYIINDGGAVIIPANSILIWTGLLINIPADYNLCDGGGGRPELRAKFLRGAGIGADPGGEGGSNTHTHTDQDAGTHSAHSQTSAGAHQHAATNTMGNHTHATTLQLSTAGSFTFNVLAGNHSHTYNNEGAHSNHTLTAPGNHNHIPWSTDDGRPAYYEVAFIQKA